MMKSNSGLCWKVATAIILLNDIVSAQTKLWNYDASSPLDTATAKTDLVVETIKDALDRGTALDHQEAKDIYQNGGRASLQAFSEDSSNLSKCTRTNCGCDPSDKLKCPSELYDKYQKYYGTSKYADEWIMAAFDNTSTDFTGNKDGNIDFKNSLEGDYNAAAIETALLSLTVFMRVIQGLNLAVDTCDTSKWDEAVALYIGSEGKTTGGVMFFELANSLCGDFGTCDQKDGIANVNHKVFRSFQVGKLKLIELNDKDENACQSGDSNSILPSIVNDIIRLMTVPIIQGLLLTTYQMDYAENWTETTRGRALAHGAAILPQLNECSIGFSNLLYRELPTDTSKGRYIGSFQVLKDSMERYYDCMGISCKEVGGIIDISGKSGYLTDAEPCGDYDPNPPLPPPPPPQPDNGSNSNNSKPPPFPEGYVPDDRDFEADEDVNKRGLAIGLGVAGGVLVIVLGIIIWLLKLGKIKKSKSPKTIVSASNGEGAAAAEGEFVNGTSAEESNVIENKDSNEII